MDANVLALLLELKRLRKEWNEADHPRVPRGNPDGGQFTEKHGEVPVFHEEHADADAARAAATEWMGKHYPQTRVNFHKIDPRLLHEIVDEYHSLAKEYPFVADKIVFFGNYSFGSEPGPKSYYTNEKGVSGCLAIFHCHDPDKNEKLEIIMNEKWFGDLDSYMNYMVSWAKDYDRIKTVGFNSPRTVVRHEFGHALRQALAASAMGGAGFTDYMLSNGVGSVMGTLGFMSNYHMEEGRKDKEKMISDYSLTNTTEWFAEAFAAIAHGNWRQRRTPGVRGLEAYLKYIGNMNEWKPNIDWVRRLKDPEERERWTARLREIERRIKGE